MKIGLQFTDLNRFGSTKNIRNGLADIAKAADDAGFYSLWVPDHLLNAMSVFGLPIDAPILEGYSAISYCAALTQKIKVGLLVTCNLFRHPALLVKAVSTIDVLSGGRTYFGIGAGWFEPEAKALGTDFPPVRERLERLEETLQIAKHMWRGDASPYEGRYYRLAEPINSPQPLSKPHPPILVGGGGERRTLRLVAKYANACNLFIGSPLKELPEPFRRNFQAWPAFVPRKLTALEQHCRDVGRSYAEIEKTVQMYVMLAPDAQDVTDIVALCRRLAEWGIQHVIFNMPNAHEIEPIQTVGNEIIPAVAGFGESSSRCG
jgi:F420-dependent oxidoreductase-like protein